MAVGIQDHAQFGDGVPEIWRAWQGFVKLSVEHRKYSVMAVNLARLPQSVI